MPGPRHRNRIAGFLLALEAALSTTILIPRHHMRLEVKHFCVPMRMAVTLSHRHNSGRAIPRGCLCCAVLCCAVAPPYI
ncbi:hypothetical protein QBC35DRAFT_488770 [Podospora australis]|uniref:Secreted protein n=1 Tax=Podospora australis TaxID=1536484 RepID=A0AAN6X0F1_9PEZI|nr:hypothetical protein QBC35DRAFT_488770 [Podospora australis]